MRLYLSSFRLGNRAEELVALLRGGKRAGVILNAADHKDSEGRAASRDQEFNDLSSLGLEPTELDLRTFFGQPEELREALNSLDMVWVRGGNSFNLRRSLRQSSADEILTELLRRDALVYAGYSAGVAVLTPTLRGIELVDDPHGPAAGQDAEIIWDGLGLVPYSIAPHFESDHPESSAVERLVQYFVENQMPFRAISDGQAIVVDGGREFTVG